MVSDERSRVGFVGVGKLGRPMAQRILEAGHDLVVFDTDVAARSAFQETTASVASSMTELVSECSIVCLCLPGPDEMEQVMLGQDGIVTVVQPGVLALHVGWPRQMVHSRTPAHGVPSPLARGRRDRGRHFIALLAAGPQVEVEREAG